MAGRTVVVMPRRRSAIDWSVAVKTGQSFVQPGPTVSAEQAADAVAGLHAAAERARTHVSDFTGLHADPTRTPVLVVDRPSWIKAAVEGFAVLAGPLEQRLAEAKGVSPLARMAGAHVTGLEVGAMLAFLSNKVLGQFDPFSEPAGRLLLVAPNIVAAERELDVPPADFRLWVCLHEETHRLQFGGVPWLADHIRNQVATLAESADLQGADLVKVVDDGLGLVWRLVRGEEEASLLDLMQSDEQRLVVERITAVMSLLEGHADVVMDGVGPEVVPSVATMRERLGKRRKGRGPIDRTVRRLLGLEAKMRQYRDGAAFVRAVIDRTGHDGFSAVWTSPEHLPTAAEIADPAHWCRRVL